MASLFIACPLWRSDLLLLKSVANKHREEQQTELAEEAPWEVSQQ